MKRTFKCALVLAVLIAAGQGITADDLVFSPTIAAAIKKRGEDISKLPPGSSGVIGPIQTQFGENFAVTVRNLCETTLMAEYPGISLFDSGKVIRALGLRPDGHYTENEITGFLSALGGPEYWIAGHVDDDGNFYIDIQGPDGLSKGSDSEIPFEKDELFRLITDLQIPPVPNYSLVQIKGEIYKTAYNHDGDLVAVTTAGGGVYVYNTHNRRLVQTIRDAGAKAIPVYMEDNRLLLAEDSGVLRIIDGNKETEIKIDQKPLSAIDVSARGRAYIGLEGIITVFDLGTKKILFNFENVTGTVRSLSLSEDGRTAVAQDGNGIGLWTVGEGKKITTVKDTAGAVFDVDKEGNIAVAKKNKIYIFSQKTQTFSDPMKAPGQPGDDADITALRFSPNGTSAYLVSGNAAGLTFTWHAAYLLGMHAIDNHLAAVSTISYRRDGTQYVTGGSDSQLFFYDGAPAEPGGSLKVVNNTDVNVSIAINSKNPREGALIGSKASKTYQNIPIGNMEISIQNPPGLVIDASGRRTADVTMTKRGYTVTIIKESAPAMDFDSDGRLIPSSLSKTPDGLLVISTRASAPGKSDSGRAFIVTLNINDGLMSTVGMPNEWHRKNINATAWSGNLFISGAEDGVFLWAGNKLETILDQERCENISVSADGKYLAASSSEYGVKLYDLGARKLIRKISGEKAVLQGGSLLYVINENEIVRESMEGARLPVFPSEELSDKSIVIPSGVEGIRIGVNNAVLVFRKDDCIEVRNAAAGTPLAVPGKTAAQNSKGTLAVSQPGGEIKIFDVKTGLPIKTILADNAVVTDLVFLEDDILASARRDGSVKIYNVTTAGELGKAGVFEDRQKVFIKGDRNYGDPIHVLKNGKRLES